MPDFNDYEEIVLHTKKWINDVVIGCNFCPFASKVVREKKVHYRIESSEALSYCLEAFLEECERLDTDKNIETTLILMPNTFQQFSVYLDLVSLAEKLLKKHEYEGIYQVASFHPDYCFANVEAEDAANYTNRSPYPMLQILREETIENAIRQYPNAKDIPNRNINFAREKGKMYMKILRDACF